MLDRSDIHTIGNVLAQTRIQIDEEIRQIEAAAHGGPNIEQLARLEALKAQRDGINTRLLQIIMGGQTPQPQATAPPAPQPTAAQPTLQPAVPTTGGQPPQATATATPPADGTYRLTADTWVKRQRRFWRDGYVMVRDLKPGQKFRLWDQPNNRPRTGWIVYEQGMDSVPLLTATPTATPAAQTPHEPAHNGTAEQEGGRKGLLRTIAWILAIVLLAIVVFIAALFAIDYWNHRSQNGTGSGGGGGSTPTSQPTTHPGNASRTQKPGDGSCRALPDKDGIKLNGSWDNLENSLNTGSWIHLQFWFDDRENKGEQSTLIPASEASREFTRSPLGTVWYYSPGCSKEEARADIDRSIRNRIAGDNHVNRQNPFVEWQNSKPYN